MTDDRATYRIAAITFGLALVLLVPARHATAKGGWSWHIADRDGFLVAGQKVKAQGVFPAAKRLPTLALAIPDWDWDNQPRRVPGDRIVLGELILTRYRHRGDRMIRADIVFQVPGTPGEYVLATCAEPCSRFSFPGPTTMVVVSGDLEARLLRRLRDRDVEIGRWEYRVARLRARVSDAEESLSDHLGYLSSHVSRISRLERLLAQENDGDDSSSVVAIAAVAGGAGALLGVRALRRRRAPASSGASR